jgi:hypothetical protein
MDKIRIYCRNTSSYEKVEAGTPLREIAPDKEILAALVDNKLKGLDYRIMNPHQVEFIGYGHPDGRRTYIRSLCFVLQYVAREMFPDKILAIDYALPSGLYCELREDRTREDGRPSIHRLRDSELEEMERRIVDDGVRLMIWCSPHNPGGRVWTEKELTDVYAVCKKHGVFIVSDEIHSDLVLYGKRHIPMAKIAGDDL